MIQQTHSLYQLAHISKYSKELNEILINITDNNIIDGTLLWVLKEQAFEINKFNNALEEDEFWARIREELNRAINTGKLTLRKEKTLSFMISPIKAKDIVQIPKKYIEDYINFITYDGLEIGNEVSIGDERLDYFEELTNSHIKRSSNSNYIKVNKVKLRILNLIHLFYKICIPLFLLFSILNIRSNLKSCDTYIKLLILSLLLSISLAIAGITYTTITSFKANSYYYFAPYYNVLIVIIVLINNKYLRKIK